MTVLDNLDQLIRIDYYTWHLKNDEISSIGRKGKEMTKVKELPITLREVEQELQLLLSPSLIEKLLQEGEVMLNADNNKYDQCKIEIVKEIQHR